MLQKDYFKGWYFKCSNENKTIAFIPAFHQSKHGEHSYFRISVKSYNLIQTGIHNYKRKYGNNNASIFNRKWLICCSSSKN